MYPAGDAALEDRFSPWVSLDGTDGLLLDITSCTHLFGSGELMVREVRMLLDDLQLASRIDMSDTITSASALSRYDDNSRAMVPVGDVGATTRSLPVAALDVPQRRASGYQNISQLFLSSWANSPVALVWVSSSRLEVRGDWN